MFITQSYIRAWHWILLSVDHNLVFVVVLDTVKEWVVYGPINKPSVNGVVEIQRVEWVNVGVHPVVGFSGHADVGATLSFNLFLSENVFALFKRLV